jgi:hypothetical protein
MGPSDVSEKLNVARSSDHRIDALKIKAEREARERLVAGEGA